MKAGRVGWKARRVHWGGGMEGLQVRKELGGRSWEAGKEVRRHGGRGGRHGREAGKEG